MTTKRRLLLCWLFAAPLAADTLEGPSGCLTLFGPEVVGTSTCTSSPEQQWSTPARGFGGSIRNGDRCLSVASDGRLVARPCSDDPAQSLTLLPTSLLDAQGRCAEVEAASLIMKACAPTATQELRLRTFERFQEELGLFGASSSFELRNLKIHPLDPSLVFLETSTTPFRSRDGGLSLTPLDLAPGPRLELDRFDRDLLYAQHEDLTWSRSEDGGVSWQKLALPLDAAFQEFSRSPLFAAPTGRGHLFLAAVAKTAPSDRIFWSGDAGRTWETRGDLPADHGFARGLAFDPSRPSRLFLTTSRTGFHGGSAYLLESNDDGRTWQVHFFVRSTGVTFDPARAGRLFLGGATQSQQAQVLRSLDGGATWSDITPQTLDFEAYQIYLGRPDEVFAQSWSRLFRSVDGGDSWTELSLGGRLVGLSPHGRHFLIKVEPGRPTLATSLLFSDDGSTFTAIAPGVGRQTLAGLIHDPGRGLSFAFGSFGLAESRDGRSWRPLEVGLAGGIFQAALEGDDGTLLLVGRTRLGTTERDSIWRLRPGAGAVEAATDFSSGVRELFRIDTTLLWISDLSELWRSDDGGQTYRKVLTPSVQAAVDPATRTILSQDFSLNLSRSLDLGETWTPSIGGRFSEIVSDPSVPGRFWSLGQSGLFRSDNSGYSFNWVGPIPAAPPTGGWHLAAARGAFVALAHDLDNRVIIARDGGLLWRDLKLASGEKPSGPGQVIIDPIAPNRLWLRSREGLFVGDFEIPAPALVDPAKSLVIQGRYRITVDFRDFQGFGSFARPQRLGGEAGLFSFWGNRPELMVKMLDGQAINGHDWLFFGSATNVAFDLTLRDWFGVKKIYQNPLGVFASVGDVRAVPSAEPFFESPSDFGDETPVVLLHERFELSVDWAAAGLSGQAHGSARANGSATFQFFAPGNRELLVNLHDGTNLNGFWWVYFGALTDVEFTLRVKDRVSGREKVYFNPAGTFASRGDSSAFPR